MARLGFWLGVLLVGALALAGCTQPQGGASATPSATANPSSGAYSGELGSVDSANQDFNEFQSWSGELQSTGDVSDSDFN